MSQQGVTLTIDPAIMMSASQNIEAQRVIIENCFSSILRDANSLRSDWEGESATAYQAAIEKIAENVPNVVSVFKDYASDLKEVATSFMTDEQKRTVQNEALPGTVFGK